MMTISQAFDQLRNNLELTGAERGNISRQQNVVRNNLVEHLAIARHFISGSYGRKTAIRPLNDIDLFIVLDEQKHSNIRSGPARACLELVQSALCDAYRGKSVRIQSRSVNIEFSGSKIGYDIVPAFATAGGKYLIPDSDRGSWIHTNPQSHKQAGIEANKRAGGMLNPLIKMAKYWNSNRGGGKLLRSFHLEVMSYDAFQRPPKGFPHGLHALFEHLAQRVLSPCRDPAAVGPRIDKGMPQDERNRLRVGLQQAAKTSAAALEYEAQGLSAYAHRCWWSLLGSAVYPEKGKEPPAR